MEESPVGSHLQGAQTHFAISSCPGAKPTWLCSEWITGEGAVFLLLADNLPPDPKGEVEPQWKEKRVKKTAR